MTAEHSSSTGIHLHVIQTERIGTLNAYVQGDIEAARRSDKGGPPVFLTVHDATKNHNAWLNFVYHPSMANVRERAVFVHVDLLGQEDEADDIKDAKKYPSMQDFGEDLVNVLDNLRIKMVIGLGEGVGANILTRFAALHASRCLGVVLISPTVSSATAMNKFKDMLVSRFPKLAEKKEDLLVMHKFGHQLSMDNDDLEDDEDLTRAFEEYKDRIKRARLNLSNSRVLMESFVKRDDIAHKVKSIVDDMLLVCGSKSAYAKETEHMFSLCDKTKTSLLKIDDVSDVLDEAPSKLAHSMLLFCKGLGWLTTLTAPGIERQRSASQSSQGGGDGRQRSISQSSTGSTGEGHNRGRRMSMEDYDKPNIRRLSLKGTE